eukprot:TRINITY_DN3585_c0_g2_i1.p1 TRINITY_DN3585_c0_g2~~TRINITY_DN3585_c0_g2_i1.p1  ORF type:complete len:260 (+),score=66.38 TRINITY_DN3585_c0_g2_i1:203-982(+)
MTALYDLFFVLGLISYFKTMFTSPGYASDLKLVDAGTCTACRTCNVYKPERAFHCNICNRCVLRIETHCVWVNNCIGYYNFKSCLLLGFYFSLCEVYYLATKVYIIFIARCGRKVFHPVMYGIYMFTGIFFLLLTALTVNFAVQTTLQLCCGVTGMERAKNVRSAHCFSCKWMKSVENFPYNVGWVANFERMFGKGGWRIFWPFAEYKDLGFEFEKIPQYDKPEEIIDTGDSKDYFEEAARRYADATIDYGNLLEINKI